MVWRCVLGGLLVVLTVPFLRNAAVGSDIDFRVYREGGAAVLFGHPLYVLHLAPHGLPFTYPPAAALCFVVLAVLPLHVAAVFWTIGSFVALIGYVRCCIVHSAHDASVSETWSGHQNVVRSRVGFSTPLVLGLVILTVISDPGAKTFAYGQINILLALLVMVDLSGSISRVPRGLLIGVAAALKLTPLFLVIVLFATRRVRAGIVATVCFCVLTLLSSVVAPADSVDYWLHGEFFDARRVGSAAYLSNQSLNGFLLRVAGGFGETTMLWLLVAAATGIMILFICRRIAPQRPGLSDGIALLGMLLVSPVSWVHHWVFALPFLVALWHLGLHRPRLRFASLVLLGLASLLTVVLLSGVIWLAPSGPRADYDANLPVVLLGNIQVLLAFVTIVVVAGFLLWPRPGSEPGE
jgi:alpha-1,2-mannosyltransferase